MRWIKRNIGAVLVAAAVGILIAGSAAVCILRPRWAAAAVCCMAALAVSLTCAFLWAMREHGRAQAAGDQQLGRVQYQLNVQRQLFGAHEMPERFTAALAAAAEYLRAEEVFFWILEPKPAGSSSFWSSKGERSAKEIEAAFAPLAALYALLEKNGSLLSYDIPAFEEAYPETGRLADDRYPVRSLMAVSVLGPEGEAAAMLGACNLKRRFDTPEPLEQVSPSFYMAISHYAAYQTLLRMGRIDTLTGLKNRNSFREDLEKLSDEGCSSLACVYIDANGLHEINNHLGHQAGDEMLKAVAGALNRAFPRDFAYRIGGDEFVVLCRDRKEDEALRGAEKVRRFLTDPSYGISVGVEWRGAVSDIDEIVESAEQAMQEDKRRFYRESGGQRQIRALNERMEQLILEKRDADTFLSVLAPEFKGVYFVNLTNDAVRHLYIPSYFEEYLSRAGDRFSRALVLYAQGEVKEEYIPRFLEVSDYQKLKELLSGAGKPEFIYQKNNGDWLRLQILKFKNYREESQETLWIFSSIDQRKELLS